MRWHRRWSLRRRVVAESLATLAVIVALACVAYSLTLQRIVVSVAEADARGQADEIAGRVETGRLTPDHVGEEVASHGSVIQIVDVSGRVVGASPASAGVAPIAALRPAAGATSRVEVDGVPAQAPQRWVVVARGARAPASAQGPPVPTTLTVLVASPLHGGSDLVGRSLVWFVGSALVLLIVVAVLLWRGVDAALAPVRRIADDVDEIRHARSPRRVTVPDSDDEIARLAPVMNRMLDRLDRADSSTRQFVSDASHELRSPLATIRAVVEGEASAAGTPACERDRVILAEALRMQRLVEDLLTLAKADDSGLGLARDEVDLDDVVGEEVRRLRATTAPQPPGDAPTVRVGAHIEPARVIGDQQRLSQVLRNLTDNAVRHCRGRVQVELCVVGDARRAGEGGGGGGSADGADLPAGEAVLTVDNDGEPIPATDREAVFDRFARLSAARERAGDDVAGGTGHDRTGRGPTLQPAEGWAAGSGLGLAIARAIVTEHGGRIVATDGPGGLCRFEVRLPLATGYPVVLADDGEPGGVGGTSR